MITNFVHVYPQFTYTMYDSHTFMFNCNIVIVGNIGNIGNIGDVGSIFDVVFFAEQLLKELHLLHVITTQLSFLDPTCLYLVVSLVHIEMSSFQL